MGDRRAAMEILQQEHANMSLLLTILERQLGAVRRDESADFGLVGQIVDYFLTYPDLVHHPKEDLLFHCLREADPASAARAEAMLSGHDDLGLLARRVARAMVDHLLQGTAETRLWFASLGENFIDMNRRHMAKEEENFFPLVEEVLKDADWTAVLQKIGGRDDPLFGDLVETRFEALHRYLAEGPDAGSGA